MCAADHGRPKEESAKPMLKTNNKTMYKSYVFFFISLSGLIFLLIFSPVSVIFLRT